MAAWLMSALRLDGAVPSRLLAEEVWKEGREGLHEGSEPRG